tara:strand:+ start:622 stop:975 length:354 start_codon:yes stop_codon:yes gene_type:complete
MKNQFVKIRLISIILLFLIGVFYLINLGIVTISVLFIAASFAGFCILSIMDLYGLKLNLKESLIRFLAYIGIIVNLGLLMLIVKNNLLRNDYLIYIGFSLLTIILSIFWRRKAVQTS